MKPRCGRSWTAGGRCAGDRGDCIGQAAQSSDPRACVTDRANSPWRVRLLLAASGQAHAQAFALPPSPVAGHAAAWPARPLKPHTASSRASKPPDAPTTRPLRPPTPAVFDTLLYNTAGELTECTRGNIALLLDGRWVTPPLRCGLLDGVGRELCSERRPPALKPWCAWTTCRGCRPWPSSTACAAGWMHGWLEPRCKRFS